MQHYIRIHCEHKEPDLLPRALTSLGPINTKKNGCLKICEFDMGLS